jgi:hypothetical protein
MNGMDSWDSTASSTRFFLFTNLSITDTELTQHSTQIPGALLQEQWLSQHKTMADLCLGKTLPITILSGNSISISPQIY